MDHLSSNDVVVDLAADQSAEGLGRALRAELIAEAHVGLDALLSLETGGRDAVADVLHRAAPADLDDLTFAVLVDVFAREDRRAMPTGPVTQEMAGRDTVACGGLV